MDDLDYISDEYLEEDVFGPDGEDADEWAARGRDISEGIAGAQLAKPGLIGTQLNRPGLGSFGRPPLGQGMVDGGFQTVRPTWKGEGLRVELRAIPGVTKHPNFFPFRFQCPPLETFRVDSAATANDYATVNHGIFTNMTGMELMTVSFDTLVTVAPAPWVVHPQYWNPNIARRRLRKIIQRQSPVRLVAWKPGNRRKRHPKPIIELNMMVTMRSMGSEERSGEPLDKYFNVDFTQWRDPVQRRRVQKRQWPIRHKLTKRDTLATLAKKYFNDASRAGQMRPNVPKLGIRWGKNTPIVKSKKYKVGDVLVLRRPRNEFDGGGPPKRGKER